MQYYSIHRHIQTWYDAYGRKSLPWRQTQDSYAIYISEIMLQQTQVTTVLKRFYFPFLERFPTLSSVAESTIEEVLHAWQGLGYYRRAHYLHQTAQIAAPTLPKEVDALIRLPGIGKSTAHAIACFTTHAPLPILDANVRRILWRFFAIRERQERVLWEAAKELLDHKEPYVYNQAMMDIGAMLCLPKAPLCERCPLASKCQGKTSPHQYPSPKKRTERPVRHTHYLWITKGSSILMRQRKTKMLGGLWELPTTKTPPPQENLLTTITHHYTHFQRLAHVYRAEEHEGIEGEWIDKKSLAHIPLSSLEKKILKQLGIVLA